jgi:hypothetical protein
MTLEKAMEMARELMDAIEAAIAEEKHSWWWNDDGVFVNDMPEEGTRFSIHFSRHIENGWGVQGHVDNPKWSHEGWWSEADGGVDAIVENLMGYREVENRCCSGQCRCCSPTNIKG